ncbi:hypothetical protein M0R45_015077 [Rubus argutus]|uniref:Uncharacterized protein n=1 Tax=Rubus argutus TaxID=59490 RepID=A0AAW1XNJ7_RUBAR
MKHRNSETWFGREVKSCKARIVVRVRMQEIKDPSGLSGRQSEDEVGRVSKANGLCGFEFACPGRSKFELG